MHNLPQELIGINAHDLMCLNRSVVCVSLAFYWMPRVVEIDSLLWCTCMLLVTTILWLLKAINVRVKRAVTDRHTDRQKDG